MINTKFLPLSINADDDARMLQNTEVLNIENLRVNVSEDGKNFQIRNIPSSQLIYQFYVPYNNVEIGTTRDYSRQRIIWFAWNDYNLHGIYCYDIPTNTNYIVLLSSQTESGFNWSRYKRIDKNARVIGDLLEWTDNNNEPQCINIEAGIKLNQPSYVTTTDAYATNIPYTTLTKIKRPPIYRLQVAKISDAGFDNNFIANNAYQFMYRYQYKNYQYSALSTYSQLIPYNFEGDTENGRNAITVAMPFTEHIDDYIQAVELCVRYGNFGSSFIVKRFDKANFYDRIAISSHNSRATQLGITFYDNQTLIALDFITANTSFHNVALRAKTDEICNNRSMLANLLKGYNTPQLTSLSATIVNTDTGGGSFAGQWGFVTLHALWSGVTGCQDSYMYPFVYSTAPGVPHNFFYFPAVRVSSTWNGGTYYPDLTATQNISDATIQSNSESDFINTLKVLVVPYSPTCTVGFPRWQTPYEISYNSFGSVSAMTLINFTTGITGFFKSSSIYYITIAFFDRFRRKCGIVQRSVRCTIPERTYSQTSFSTTIQWALNNNNTLNEIPDWAYYYQIHITRNQTTRFFEQVRTEGADYVIRNQDGTFDYGHNTFANGTYYAVAIDISKLSAFGFGYTFTEGDLIRVGKSDGSNVVLNVLGVDGNFVFCRPVNLGTLDATTTLLVELYTPYKPSETEAYFETGDVMAISSPGTVLRSYSVLSGTLNGDSYGLERDFDGSTQYIVEAMSPNDDIWQIWQTDTGWPNFVDTIGQQSKPTAIDWSDTFINGTKTNGLNVYQPLNTKDIGSSSGDIQKIQLTNKQQEDGSVLLIITESTHLSAYLGEVQLYAAAQAADIVTTDAVIGTINPLKNGQGSINPESIEEYNGVVWGVSVINGNAWQYANDGVTVISDYKMNRVFDRWCKRYIALGYNSDYQPMQGGYDPSSDEYLLNMPAVEDATFLANFPSYDDEVPSYATSIKNRFDFYDGQQKIFIYKPQSNKWVGSYGWNPDGMVNLGSKFFNFKTGWLWLMNENFTNFNGVFDNIYTPRLWLPLNIGDPSAIKDVMDLALECNGNAPTYVVLYSNYPYEQITDLVATDFENKEGVLYATFFKDRLSPNVIGTAVKRMYEGDLINSVSPLLMMEWSLSNSIKIIVNFVNVGVNLSRGQLGILNKK